MKIAVNARLLLPGKLDGIGWFTWETLSRIVCAHPEHEFYFIFDRKYDREFIFSENVTPVVYPPPTRHPLLWFIWFELVIPYVLKKTGADLFLSTDGFLSLRSGVPSVSVIHDINFEHRPGDLPFLTRSYYRHFFPKFAARANRIVTVSEYSRRDIINHFNIPESKIDMVYNGANELFAPIPDSRKAEIRKKYTNGSAYFIFVGSLHPRKNITNLLKAFQLFKDELKNDFKLVIVGKKFFLNNEMEEQFNRMKDKEDVIFTGRLPPADLNDLLGAAYAMTFVPFFEGFGIPVVEAMYCDLPIITSNVTSLPEIAGDAALFTDPESPGSIRDAMVRIVKDQELRKSLIEKGRQRRDMFSWDNTASGLWLSIQKVLNTNA
ncbi:MAG TPA: glycosyltransferase family 1 protein [Bacteroidaceae bacterium]|nr:glycosyltransferase family 1 protein [Bacteroidaceae bacterium]